MNDFLIYMARVATSMMVFYFFFLLFLKKGYQFSLLSLHPRRRQRQHAGVGLSCRGSAARPDGARTELAELLNETYGDATGLPYYPTITRRMTSYYAFNARRYDHALHPMTVGTILETGFLTNAGDRRILVDDPDRAARASLTRWCASWGRPSARSPRDDGAAGAAGV